MAEFNQFNNVNPNPGLSLLSPYIKISLGKMGTTEGDTFTIGDGRLISASVTLGEGKTQSNCSFSVLDWDRKLTDKYLTYIEKVSGLDPVEAPKATQENNVIYNQLDQNDASPGKVIYENVEASTYGYGEATQGGEIGAWNNPIDWNGMQAAMVNLKYKFARMRVTNLSNNKSIIVQIVDRGPWAKDSKGQYTLEHPTRKMDLVPGAWKALTNNAPPGIVRVRIEWLEAAPTTASSSNKDKSTQQVVDQQNKDIKSNQSNYLPFNKTERVNDWPVAQVGPTKSIILVPGHRLDISTGTNGSNGSSLSYQGEPRTVESVATEIAALVFKNVLVKAGYTLISPPPIPAARGDDARRKYQDEVQKLKEQTGAYALELHFDEPTGQSGVIPGGKYDASGNSLSVLDVALAKAFGSFSFNHRRALGAPSRGITILEISPLNTTLTNLTVQGVNNNNFQPLSDALHPFAEKAVAALSTVAMIGPSNQAINSVNGSNVPLQESVVTPVTLAGSQITVELGYDGKTIAAYSFIHTGVRFSLFQPNTLEFTGQAASWVLTQRVKNTVYTNLSLKKIAQRITSSYGMKLEMPEEGPTYEYFYQRGQTDYDALLIEARRVGYRVYTKGPTLYIQPRQGVTASKDIFLLEYGVNMGLSFEVAHQAQSDTTGGARSSSPGANNTTGERKFEIDPDSGKLVQKKKENVQGVGRDGAIATTGTPTPFPAPKTTGSTDKQDAERKANEDRIKGIVATTQFPTSPEALLLDPDTPFLTKGISTFLDRMWIVDNITHSYKSGSFVTNVRCYSPLKNKRASSNIPTIDSGLTSDQISGKVVKAEATGSAYLLALRSGDVDEYSIEILKVYLVDKDGNIKDSVNAGAGTTGNQIFRGPNQRQANSLEPLEEGLYTIGAPISSSNQGMGVIVLPLTATFTTMTSGMSIHVDANRKTGPGSLGSLAIHTLGEFNKLKNWVADNNITQLRTYWGINSDYGKNIVKEVVASTGFIIPTKGTYTSPFGPRGGKNHNGIDIANSIGTPIYAAASGIVSFADFGTDANQHSGYGNVIDIDHPNNMKTRYGHLMNGGILVKVGQQVQQGQLIGYMGSTGRSTGPHLHWEILINGLRVNPGTFVKLPNLMNPIL